MSLNKYSLEKDADYINYRLGSPERFNSSNPRGYSKPYKKRKDKNAKSEKKVKRPITPAEISTMIAMHNQGHRAEEIAASLGHRPQDIRRRLNKARREGWPVKGE